MLDYEIVNIFWRSNMSERKKRFKMYKSGKNWVVAPIVFLGVTLFEAGMTNSVSADSVSSVSNSQSNVQVAAYNNHK